MNIFIIGMMGAGKTTLARELASKLGCAWQDTDAMVERKFNISIAEFWLQFGEERFREEECALLPILRESKNLIVSTGGGFPCFNDNMRWLNDEGLTVFLNTDVDLIVKRMCEAGSGRPLIAGKSGREMRSALMKMRRERLSVYNQAHIAVNVEAEMTEVADIMLERFPQIKTQFAQGEN